MTFKNMAHFLSSPGKNEKTAQTETSTKDVKPSKRLVEVLLLISTAYINYVSSTRTPNFLPQLTIVVLKVQLYHLVVNFMISCKGATMDYIIIQ